MFTKKTSLTFSNTHTHTSARTHTHTRRLYFWISLLPPLCIFALIEAPTRRSVQPSPHLPATLQLTKHQEAHSAACVTAHLLIRTRIPTPACTQDFLLSHKLRIGGCDSGNACHTVEGFSGASETSLKWRHCAFHEVKSVRGSREVTGHQSRCWV